MNKWIIVIVAIILASLLSTAVAEGAPPKRAKFYDFSEQVIDGQIKRPTALYTDSRQKVKFNRLLKLKKSFVRDMLDTAKENVFK
jgi:hypothetical protein